MSEWKSEGDELNMLCNIISMHHPHLADLLGHIAITFKDGSQSGRPAKTIKANSTLLALCDNQYKFIITINWLKWSKLTDPKRAALLDHQLCHIQGKETSSGEMVYSLVSPDVCYFSEEMERHGTWRTDGDDQ